VVFQLLAPHEVDAPSSALPLRMMGAVHRLVLERKIPDLAQFYPSMGGEPNPDQAWRAFRTALASKVSDVTALLNNPVQTNEVGRAGTLLGGFLRIAEEFQLPLRLLEFGTSAGLNLCWDRYRYEWTGGAWGDASSSVCLNDVFVNQPPNFLSTIAIAERAGCDKHPIDVKTEEGRLTLLSFTWADQVERIARLKSACEIARTVSFSIQQSSAAIWLEQKLSEIPFKTTTVIFHSVVWQYISQEEQEQIRQIIGDAGQRASIDAPLAWLRMEPEDPSGSGPPALRLRTFPGRERLLATSTYHAPSVRWLA
jgi:hypothetical protein